MTEDTKTLSHGRLITRFTQLGPYLRKDKSSEERYFFDCLSVCVDAEEAPDEREFWGWWLELDAADDGFSYDYHFGKFDANGDWVDESMPNKHNKEVQATVKDFYQKLTSFVVDDLGLTVTPASGLKKPKLN